MVIAWCSAWDRPSSVAPWTWLSAPNGLTIWLPTSAATHIFLTFTSPAGLTATWHTSAK